MAKTGRPTIKIDWKLFDGFCQMQCTLWEIACYFNCSEDTIERRVRQEFGVSFAEYFGKKRIAGLISLRRNLFRQSETNPACAIFLAKNYLGMSDKQEVEHSGSIGKANPEDLTDAELIRIIMSRQNKLDRSSRGRRVTEETGSPLTSD